MIKVGLSTDNSWLANSIRWFEKRQTGDAIYTHAFILLDDGLIIESMPLGLRVSNIEKYRKDKTKKYAIYAPRFLGAIGSESIKREALYQVGTYNGIYGLFKLPLFAVDALFKTYWFTQHIGTKHFKVCSQFVAYLFYKYTSYLRWTQWRSYSPDRLYDEMEASTSEWLCVEKREVKHDDN